MSRHSHDDVWKHHYDLSPEVACPSCQKVILYREASPGEKRNWQRGHIIHHKNQGPDILENIRPICLTCNAKDKKYYSNYHYMVKLGLMTQKEAEDGCKKIMDEYDRKRLNPYAEICIGSKKNGARCKLKQKPRSLYCAVHEKQHIASLQAIYKEKFCNEILKIRRTMKILKELEDEEAMEALREYTLGMCKIVRSY